MPCSSWSPFLHPEMYRMMIIIPPFAVHGRHEWADHFDGVMRVFTPAIHRSHRSEPTVFRDGKNGGGEGLRCLCEP